jgi:hypothetical protein
VTEAGMVLGLLSFQFWSAPTDRLATHANTADACRALRHKTSKSSSIVFTLPPTTLAGSGSIIVSNSHGELLVPGAMRCRGALAIRR